MYVYMQQVHLGGASHSTVTGNRIDATIGVWLDSSVVAYDKPNTKYIGYNPHSNAVTGNTLTCSFCGAVDGSKLPGPVTPLPMNDGSSLHVLDDNGGGGSSGGRRSNRSNGVNFNASSFVGIVFAGAVGNTVTGNTIDGSGLSNSVALQFTSSSYIPPGAVPVAAVDNIVTGNSFLGVGRELGGSYLENNSFSANIFVHRMKLDDSIQQRPRASYADSASVYTTINDIGKTPPPSATAAAATTAAPPSPPISPPASTPTLKTPLVDVYYPGLNKHLASLRMEGGYRSPSLLFVPPLQQSTPLAGAGTLLAAVESKRWLTNADNANATLALRRSTDLGTSWSRLIFPYKTWADYRMYASPQMTFDTITRTVLLMLTNCSTVKSYCTSVLQIQSSDAGLTWTEPNEAQVVDVRTPQYPRSSFFGPTDGNGIQLRPGHPFAGRLIFSMNSGGIGGYSGDQLLLSDNHGATYNATYGLNKPNQSELQLVQLGNGSILAVIRNRGSLPGCSYNTKNSSSCSSQRKSVAISTDGGASFSPIRYHDDLVGPTCQGSVLWVGGQTVLYASPRSSGVVLIHPEMVRMWQPRTHMTVHASDDNGEHFHRSLLIYPFSGPMYSSMQLLPTGEVALLFERDGGGNMSLARFNVSDLR
eukprot:COSAG05_NODE_837_length_7054_cov_2.683537_1_plen_645_part_00